MDRKQLTFPEAQYEQLTPCCL
uniref:Uncharacterized protein n=1 Tax=Anguilla anguilla TaxID=7936 RepID=A0A0E9Q1R7_ANGAN